MVYDKERQRWIEEDGTDRLPHRPDAFFTLRLFSEETGEVVQQFFYEADRGTMNTTYMRMKLRAHFHFVALQKEHREIYRADRIRAVLVESLIRREPSSCARRQRTPSCRGEIQRPCFGLQAATASTACRSQHREADNAHGARAALRQRTALRFSTRVGHRAREPDEPARLRLAHHTKNARTDPQPTISLPRVRRHFRSHFMLKKHCKEHSGPERCMTFDPSAKGVSSLWKERANTCVGAFIRRAA